MEIRRQELPGLGLLLGLIFLWTLAPLQGYDFWFYLTVGRDIFAGEGIPWAQSYLGNTNEYAFGAYANHAWLCSLTSYLFYHLGGPLGLVALRSLVLTILSSLTYLNCRLAGLTPLSAGLWTAVGLWSVRSRFLLRSYLFTDLCLAVLVGLVLLHYRRPNLKRLLVGVPLLFVVWTNTHQGYVAGLVLIFIWVVFGGVPRKFGCGLFAVACLATLFKPHGIAFVGFYYDTFTNSSAIGGVLEWESLSFIATLEHLGVLLLAGGVLLGYGLVRIQKKLQPAPPWSHLVIVAAFLFLGLRSMRGILELFPVVVPLAATFFPPLKPPRWAQILVISAVCALYLGTYSGHSFETLKNVDRLYPVHLAEAVREQPGQVFNSYEFGNFLAMQRIPPFIHGMTALYREGLIRDFLDILNPSDKRLALLEKYQVESALLHYPTEVDAHTEFVEFLFATTDWKLALWDDTGLLFTKAPAQEGYGHVRPWRKEMYTDPVAAKAELEHLIKRRPSARAHTLLSELYAKEDDIETAGDHARKAVILAPTDGRAWSAVALAAAKRGDLAKVLEATEKLVTLRPDDAPLHYNRALALIEQRRSQSGLASWWTGRKILNHLETCLELNPEFEPARSALSAL